MPTIRLPQFMAIISGHADPSRHGLRLTFETAPDQRYEIRVHGGVLGALLITLVERMRELAKLEGRTTEEQPLELLGAVPASFPDGNLGFVWRWKATFGSRL